MKGDFSRLTFDPARRYSSVRMQQGRLQIDADWNEQMDIIEHRIAAEIQDFLGASGTPSGPQGGFAITAGEQGVTIGKGRFYLDGLLLENPADCPFGAQPDRVGARLPDADGRYLAYLDVWQRHVGGLEDPTLLEPALGGADTATRLKNVWQLRLLPLTEADRSSARDRVWLERTLAEAPHAAPMVGDGALIARAGTAGAVSENQLYRVEIHQGGAAGAATFKWSRDNGTVAARATLGGSTIALAATGENGRVELRPNDWLELVDEGLTLECAPGWFAQVLALTGGQVEVEPWQSNEAPQLDPASTVLRRWEQEPQVVPGSADRWLPLEDGVEICFANPDASYRSGDYWLIPARAAAGGLLWPNDDAGKPAAQRPHGILHHYCALALLARTGGVWSLAQDLRTRFAPLSDGTVSKSGDTMTGKLTIQSALEVTGEVTFAGTTKLNGQLQANGRVDLGGTLTISAPPATGSNPLIELSGAAMSDTNNNAVPTLRVNGVDVPLTNPLDTGLNTFVLGPDGTSKGNFNNNIYTSQDQWNVWASWIKNLSTDGDIIAVVSYDAIGRPPQASDAWQFLNQIGAAVAQSISFDAGAATNIARLPYTLLFVKGRAGGARENLGALYAPSAPVAARYRELLSPPPPPVEQGNSTFLKGMLGIGTAAPMSALSVAGGAAVGSSYARLYPAPVNSLIVEGSVGIGTTTPQARLAVGGGVVIGADIAGKEAAPQNGLLVQGDLQLTGTANLCQIERTFGQEAVKAGTEVNVLMPDMELRFTSHYPETILILFQCACSARGDATVIFDLAVDNTNLQTMTVFGVNSTLFGSINDCTVINPGDHHVYINWFQQSKGPDDPSEIWQDTRSSPRTLTVVRFRLVA